MYKDNLTQLGGKVGGLIFVYDKRPVQFISRAVYTLPFPVVAVGPWFGKEAKSATLKLDAEFIEDYKAVNIASFIEGKTKSDEHIIFLATMTILELLAKATSLPEQMTTHQVLACCFH